jgi:hypothetical protein
VEDLVDLDQLDEPHIAKCGEQLVEVEPRQGAGGRSDGLKYARPHGVLESPTLPLENDARGSRGLGGIEPAGHLTQRRELGDELWIVGRRHAG